MPATAALTADLSFLQLHRSGRPPALLPVGPLVRMMPALSFDSTLGVAFGQGREALARAYLRARHTGRISHHHDDLIAVEILGLHPAEVWGPLWWLDDWQLAGWWRRRVTSCALAAVG